MDLDLTTIDRVRAVMAAPAFLKCIHQAPVTGTRIALLTLLLLSLPLAAGRLQAQDNAGAAASDEIITAPIELDGVVLFRVRGISSLPAEARANLIRDRIAAAAADRALPVDSIRVIESQGIVRIVARDLPIMAVASGDASLEQVSPTELAQAHAERVKQAIAEYRGARSRAALQRAALATLIATVLFALVLAAAVWLWRWLDRRLSERLHARIHTVGIQSFEVMRAESIWRALRSALFGLRTLVFFASALIYLGYLLARWPWTRGLSRDLASFVLGPLEVIARSIVAYIPSLVFLAVLFIVFRVALRVLRLFFDAVAEGRVALARFDAEWAQPTYKIIRVAVIAFGIIVAYPYIPGSQSEAFKGVSIFIGIVFSLGSSSAISNIIAGYMMTYRRAFKVGDRVKIGDTIGDVIETRLQVTHLRSYKNEEMIIPNSQILSGEVLNYSSLARSEGLILHTEVGIGYETPWRQVEAMLLTAAERTGGLASDPRPFVLLKRLGDFAVTYELNVFCRQVSLMNQLYTALHRNILDVFNEYGVQIMTPAYEGDPAEPKVVAPKDWYAAPASGSSEPTSSINPAALDHAATT
jgi:small-conductance mechanosensitive channel